MVELRRLRDSIDNMDAALVHLLAERFKITQQVGVLKAAHGLPPADPAREAQQIQRLRDLAVEAKLDPEFAEKFLSFVVAEVTPDPAASRRGPRLVPSAPGREARSTHEPAPATERRERSECRTSRRARRATDGRERRDLLP